MDIVLKNVKKKDYPVLKSLENRLVLKLLKKQKNQIIQNSLKKFWKLQKRLEKENT